MHNLLVFGQQPGLNIYTQLCFGFPVADASSHSAIINRLTNGEGKPGIFKIKPLEKIPRLVVKDLRIDPSIPTMDALRRANFPFSMLDESIIAPRKTLPCLDESESDSPLFLLQANFITGGLLLTFLGQHQAMDMTGQGQVIYLLSKACRNEPFTSEELSIGNIARHNIIPLLDDSYKQGPELARQIIKPTPSDSISNSATNVHAAPPKCTWAYFTFPPTSLTALKSLATKIFITLPSGYISTDDALSAFIWQSVIRVRLPRLHPTAEATFARAVDPRRYLDIPQTYPGVVQNMTYHTYPIQKLVAEPLGGVASQLRSALDPKTPDLGYRTRALATVLNRALDKSIISVVASLDLSVDIMLSSWAKEHCYELDFNLGLGKPEALRRPQFVPVESLMYLMPKALDGEIALGICLRDEDMERLRADEEFAKYATYIG
ncbi:transferase family-domain-containing protein [Lipomyces starkeyi]